jgi:hypothetical protein
MTEQCENCIWFQGWNHSPLGTCCSPENGMDSTYYNSNFDHMVYYYPAVLKTYRCNAYAADINDIIKNSQVKLECLV